MYELERGMFEKLDVVVVHEVSGMVSGVVGVWFGYFLYRHSVVENEFADARVESSDAVV